MTDQVEKLAIELWSVLDPLGITKWETLTEEQREFYRSRARHLFNAGYIPKESVLELVGLCSSCYGTGYEEECETKCLHCQGRGIVLRGEK